MAHIVLKSRKEISSHLTTSSTRIPVMDQRGFEHSTRALPHRDGRDARRDLHDRPAVSVHGLRASASTPPDLDPVFTMAPTSARPSRSGSEITMGSPRCSRAPL